jgi:hypothetical protein
MDFEIEFHLDEHFNLNYPYFKGRQRPRHVVIGSDPIAGIESSPENLESDYVRIRESSLMVPRREAFAAAGGDLPYDVIFIVGFDGIESPVEDVRYLRRPNGPPVTSTLIRTVRIDPLVKQAISEYRTAYRRKSDTLLVWVGPDERQSVYLTAMDRSVGESRRRITDSDLRRVAKVYLHALADRVNPTEAVEKELRLPNRNTAKKWVQASRRAAFLPPALGERRGGAN